MDDTGQGSSSNETLQPAAGGPGVNDTGLDELAIRRFEHLENVVERLLAAHGESYVGARDDLQQLRTQRDAYRALAGAERSR